MINHHVLLAYNPFLLKSSLRVRAGPGVDDVQVTCAVPEASIHGSASVQRTGWPAPANSLRDMILDGGREGAERKQICEMLPDPVLSCCTNERPKETSMAAAYTAPLPALPRTQRFRLV